MIRPAKSRFPLRSTKAAGRSGVAAGLLGLLFLLLGAAGAEPSRERTFAVVVLNGENLFDLDGVADFADYRQDKAPGEGVPYSAGALLAKLDFLSATLATVNGGRGPEIILFQELERDRTPSSGGNDWAAFHERYGETTVRAMLEPPVEEEVRGLPAVALLAKHLHDEGLGPYEVALPPAGGESGEGPPHVNATFSTFPIERVMALPLRQARELLVVVHAVEGYRLITLNNHWKSGASDPTSEPIRRDNARTVRNAVDLLLEADPRAEILVGGDLNSYYNQGEILPPGEPAGLTDLLGSQGNERATAAGKRALYNLWYELPPPERYSEVWRGVRSSLMHLLHTPGLYDASGIRYVDGSFRVLRLPGITADSWGRPREFSFGAGDGARGGSDHFPLLARYEVVPPGAPPLTLVDPGRPRPGEDLIYPFDYRLDRPGAPPVADLADLHARPREEWPAQMGRPYRVEGTWVSGRPLRIRVDGRVYPVYAFRRDLRTWLAGLRPGTPVSLVGEWSAWRGRYQFLVRDPSWILAPRPD